MIENISQAGCSEYYLLNAQTKLNDASLVACTKKINRVNALLFESCLYSIKALLASDGIIAVNQSDVIKKFIDNYVKTRLVSIELFNGVHKLALSKKGRKKEKHNMVSDERAAYYPEHADIINEFYDGREIAASVYEFAKKRNTENLGEEKASEENNCKYIRTNDNKARIDISKIVEGFDYE